MKKLTIALFALLLTVCLTASAFALTKSTTMTVEANVVIPALISTTNMNFGNFDGVVDGAATSTISVTVENGLPYDITINAGNNYDGSYRNVVGASGGIWYALFDVPVWTGPEWGDAGYVNSYPTGYPTAGVGTGANQDITCYGALQATSGYTSGSYTDTVLVTVNY